MNLNYTFFGQMFFFLVFVAFCMKYVWPPIVGAMAERTKKIADGLEAADRANRDLELAKGKIADELRAAKSQAAEILEQARKRSDQMVEEAKLKAKEEGDRLKLAAQAEISQEVNRAREELRSSLAVLAITGAEKILETTVDHGRHSAMLDKLASEL